jgi:hypothetical protein
LARELGVDLSNVTGTGQKGRVLDTDLKGYVKQIITSGSMGSALPKTPNIDFSKSRVCGADVSVVVVFGVGVDIGVETAVTGASSLGALTATLSILRIEEVAEMVDTEPKIIPVMVPDIGDFDEVEVIDC